MARAHVLGLLVLAALCLAGCANLSRWDRIEIGMSPAQVKALMGHPQEVDAGDEGQGLAGSWMYKNLCGTEYYEIVFDKGKVAEKFVRSIRSI